MVAAAEACSSSPRHDPIEFGLHLQFGNDLPMIPLHQPGVLSPWTVCVEAVARKVFKEDETARLEAVNPALLRMRYKASGGLNDEVAASLHAVALQGIDMV